MNNKHSKLVSIIVPIFNGAEFIVEAYKNILGQNLPSFEIIFIDNNSTDDSVTIIESLINKDARIKLLFEKKQGAGAARNKGIKNAMGDYIYFFDVDDIILNESLLSLKKVLDTNNEIDSVFGDWIQIRHRNISKFIFKRKETLLLEKHKSPYYGMRWFENISLLYGTPSFLHRKEVFNKIGLFPESITIGEDATFHIRLGLNCNVAFLDKFIYAYYRHSNSTMSKVNRLYEKVLLHWPQYVNVHIPYFFNNETPKQYKIILEKRVFVSMAKMLILKDIRRERIELLDKLKKEIQPLKTPFIINVLLNILAITNSKMIFKSLIYYIIPIYIKQTNK